LLIDNLNYVDGYGFYTGNTSATYFVNGASKSLAAFSSELSVVANGTKTGTISVVDNGAVTEFRITTATNTASATMTAVADPGTGGTTQLVLTFDKPVYLSEAWAPADFTIVGSSTHAVADSNAYPTDLAHISNQVNLMINPTTTFVNGEDLTVTLSATGAAKFLDANGVAATAGHVTVLVHTAP
jgi:hypothetical protein